MSLPNDLLSLLPPLTAVRLLRALRGFVPLRLARIARGQAAAHAMSKIFTINHIHAMLQQPLDDPFDAMTLVDRWDALGAMEYYYEHNGPPQ